MIKEVDELTIADLREHPVWEFVTVDETTVKPVLQRPENLENRVVGLEIELAGGTLSWATVGNIDVQSEPLTSQFLSISLYAAGRWNPVLRYFDPGFGDDTIPRLVAALGLAVEQVFPLTMDMRPYVAADSPVLFRQLHAKPPVLLSRQQLIELAIRRLH